MSDSTVRRLAELLEAKLRPGRHYVMLKEMLRRELQSWMCWHRVVRMPIISRMKTSLMISITVAELAKRWHVSPNTIRRLVADGPGVLKFTAGLRHNPRPPWAATLQECSYFGGASRDRKFHGGNGFCNLLIL